MQLVPKLGFAAPLILVRPDGFEPPTTWFEVGMMILLFVIFQPLSRPALTRNRHRRAGKGIKRYVLATVSIFRFDDARASPILEQQCQPMQ